VFRNPLPGECAVLDLLEDLFHRRTDMLVDNARTTGIVAVLGRVTDRVAHVAEPALIEEVDNELELMQTLEIRDLRLISGFDQRLESGLYQRADSAAKHRLFAKQIALGLLFESGFDVVGVDVDEAGRDQEAGGVDLLAAGGADLTDLGDDAA